MEHSDTPDGGKTVLLFSCSGGANVGEIADEVVRRLMFAGKGEMYCLAGLGGQLDEFLEKTRGADTIVLVEGCDEDCGRHIMERAGFENYKYVRVTDLGIEKDKPKRAREDEIALVMQRVEALL